MTEYVGHERWKGVSHGSAPGLFLFVMIAAASALLLSGFHFDRVSVYSSHARQKLVDIMSPALGFFATPVYRISTVVGYGRDYVRVLQQNSDLRRENAGLRHWKMQAQELRQILSAYEGLHSYTPPPRSRTIDAFVIGETGDAFARSMIVNAGRNHGVRNGYAVIDENGLAGRVVDAGAVASRVLLLTDLQSRIPVYIEDAGVEGILAGNTEKRPLITALPESDRAMVFPGQRVLTSGTDGMLPRGLPVGSVAGTGGEIPVSLYADYVRMRLVRIVGYGFPRPGDGL